LSGLVVDVTGVDGKGSLATLTMGQRRARIASEAAATLLGSGHWTGGLGLVTIARRSKTTVAMNQSPAKKTKPSPNPKPKAVGSVTPLLTMPIPIARNDPTRKQVQIAAAAKQKR
jgi:hypothetical protein